MSPTPGGGGWGGVDAPLSNFWWVGSPTLLLLAVTVLHSDEEAAFSRANVAQLKQQVPRLRRVIRYNPRAGKAYQVNPADLSLGWIFLFFVLFCSGRATYRALQKSRFRPTKKTG